MFCRLFLGVIICRVMENVVVVDDGLNIGGDKVS